MFNRLGYRLGRASWVMALVAASIGFNLRPASAATPAVSLVVRVEGPQAKAPSHFLGLSLSMSGLCQLMETDATYQTQFENLLHDLGPVVLKIAGVGADYSRWEPNGTPQCAKKSTVLTADMVTDLFALAGRVNARVLWGLPLARFNPAADASEAAFVQSVSGTRLAGWVIGNEPDLYHSNGARPSGWKFVQFLRQWERVKDAVEAVDPEVGVIGPEQCCDATYFSKFAEQARGQMTGLSFHFYAGSRTNLTSQYLLGSPAAHKAQKRMNRYWTIDRNHARVPLMITEANTFPDSGVQGVSDTYASTLWLLDFLFRAAEDHVGQVDVQQVESSAAYNPVTVSAGAQPMFYGMLAYHQMAPSGARFLATRLHGSANVAAYAETLRSGATGVVLINKTARDQGVEVATPKPSSSGTYFLLQAGGDAPGDILIGNQSVAGDGTFPTPESSQLQFDGVQGTVWTVPADSAMFITLNATQG